MPSLLLSTKDLRNDNSSTQTLSENRIGRSTFQFILWDKYHPNTKTRKKVLQEEKL